MSTFLLALAVVLLWVLIGLAAALLVLGRRGYRSELGYLVGAVLGPLFVPIAMERGRRVTVDTGTPARRESSDGITVLVGVDGSAESDSAVREAARLFAPGGALILLVRVADPTSPSPTTRPGRAPGGDCSITGRAGSRRTVRRRCRNSATDSRIACCSRRPRPSRSTSSWWAGVVGRCRTCCSAASPTP